METREKLNNFFLGESESYLVKFQHRGRCSKKSTENRNILPGRDSYKNRKLIFINKSSSERGEKSK